MKRGGNDFFAMSVATFGMIAIGISYGGILGGLVGLSVGVATTTLATKLNK